MQKRFEPIRFVDQYTYLNSSISSTESDLIICIAKAWTAIDRLSIRKKSDLSDNIKREFYQAVAVSVLLYEYTIWSKEMHGEKASWELQ